MNNGNTERKPVRVYVDGCFDLSHYGHANAIRQAKQLGDYVIAGVHSDAEILANKGPPVYTEQERYRLIRAIRWVDEVYEGAPYSTSVELLRKLNVDFQVHGDDVSISAETGEDCNIRAKEAGLFREVKRTVGVSTTDIVGRILLVTKTHHVPHDDARESPTNAKSLLLSQTFVNSSPVHSNFLTTSRALAEFSPRKSPAPGDRIVYTAGAFDLLHAGHVDFLAAAKKEGDFLIVGIHPDMVVNRYMGYNHPIQNLHERTLGVLALRYVDEVIIGAPYTLTAAAMDQLQIACVLHGNTDIANDVDGGDPYNEAKRRNAFKIIDSGSSITTTEIISRILKLRSTYEERNRIAKEKFRRQEQYKASRSNGNTCNT